MLGLSPQPEYLTGAREANARLPKRARLLFVAGLKSYYFERRAAIPHQHIDPIPLVRLMREAGGAGRLAVRLKQAGYTHLVYMPRAALAYPCPGVPEMTDAEARAYVDWLRRDTAYEFRAGETLFYSLGRNARPRRLGRVPLLEDGGLRTLSGPSDHPALRAFSQLAALAPESSSYSMLRGVRLLLGGAGGASAAAPHLATASRDPEVSSVAWRAYGFSLFTGGEYGRALAAFRRAVELNPSDAEAHYDAGEVFVRMGRWDAARDAFATACRNEPGNARYRGAYMGALERTGERR